MGGFKRFSVSECDNGGGLFEKVVFLLEIKDKGGNFVRASILTIDASIVIC